MQDFSRFKCPYIDRNEIWENADNFRAEFWPENSIPIDVESIIEKHLRLNIEPSHGLFNELDIDAYLKRDLTGIVVDYRNYMDEKFINRMRFSFAHEVGHLILHKTLYTQFPINDLDEWKNFILTVPDREYGFFEYQANEFAGRVLVPREKLISELESCVNEIQDERLLEYLKTNPEAVLSSIGPTLCRPFGVSNQVIELRVQRESLWPPKIDSRK